MLEIHLALIVAVIAFIVALRREPRSPTLGLKRTVIRADTIHVRSLIVDNPEAPVKSQPLEASMDDQGHVACPPISLQS